MNGFDRDPEEDQEIDIGGYRLPFSLRQPGMAAADPSSGVPPSAAPGATNATDATNATPTSFGARIASPAPATSATPAAAADPNAPPDPSKVAPFPANLPAGVMHNVGPSDIPKPPTGANNMRRMDLLRQMGPLEKPTDRNAVDPQTGKPMYKMGIGSRILGTVGNFLTGFGGGRGPTTYVGPGATNAKYDIAENTREKQLGGVKEELGEQEKLDTSEQKIYEDAIRQAYESQLGEARTATADAAEGRARAAGETADVKAQLAQSQKDLNEARAQKAEAPKTPTNEVELVQAYQSETDPKKKAALKGALDQLAALKAAGKDTSAAELAKIIQIQNQKAGMIDKVNKEKETERDRRYKELDKNIQLKYSPEKMAAERQKVDNDLDTKYAPRLQQASDEADKLLGLTKKGSALQSPAAKTTPAKPGSTPAEPRIRVRDKTTGKAGTIPQSQVKAAVDSGKYERL